MGRNTGPRYGELCTVQCTLYIYVQVEEQSGILDRDMGNYVLYSVHDIFMYRLRNMAEYWTEIWGTMY